MVHASTILRPTVLFGAVLAGFLLGSQPAGQARGDIRAAGTTKVRVINTPAEPLPVSVTGQPNIQGSVQVSNAPTVLLSPSGNTVRVDSTTPVRVTDATPPAEVFQQTVAITIANGVNEANPGFTLPAGRRILIEHAHALVDLQEFTAPAFATLVLNSTEAYLPLGSAQAGSYPGRTVYAYSQPMKLVVDPGDTLTAWIKRNSTAGLGVGTVTLTGVLLPSS